MSDISESARVSIILADFANVDGTGKLNFVGAGVAITGIDAASGQTAPLTAVVMTSVDPRFIGQEYALELALYSADDGQLVVSPGPLAGTPIRVGRPVTVEQPKAPGGGYVPPGTVWPGSTLVVSFQNGLPIAAGRGYEWRASVDGNVVCTTNLLVAGPPPVAFG